jgi:hypothetical protein
MMSVHAKGDVPHVAVEELLWNAQPLRCVNQPIIPLGELLAQGQTQGSTLQQRTNKTLTTGPFGNTCEADEVSPEVEAGVVAGLRCLQP